MTFGKNPQHDFPKMRGWGQRPFGTFLKIPPFWYAQMSLFGDDEKNEWYDLYDNCSGITSFYMGSREVEEKKKSQVSFKFKLHHCIALQICFLRVKVDVIHLMLMLMLIVEQKPHFPVTIKYPVQDLEWLVSRHFLQRYNFQLNAQLRQVFRLASNTDTNTNTNTNKRHPLKDRSSNWFRLSGSENRISKGFK